MKVESVLVEMKLLDFEAGKVRAFATLTINLGEGGLFRISGFSVGHPEGREPYVLWPSRKSKDEKRFFDVVWACGQVRELTEARILDEYEKRRKK